MWTAEHRRAADRRGLRYRSDLTDTAWALVAPLIRPAKRGGRPRSVDVREVLNAMFYVLSTGCQWNALPSDLPPRSTVWTISIFGNGTAPSPASTTCSMSQRASAPDARPARPRRSSTHRTRKARQKGGSLDPSGYDAGKKILGRKRHVLVDTQGLLLSVDVHAADIQDRDGAEMLLRQARRLPFIERNFSDGLLRAPLSPEAKDFALEADLSDGIVSVLVGTFSTCAPPTSAISR